MSEVGLNEVGLNDIDINNDSNKTDETRIAESVVKNEYTNLFNKLTKDKPEKYLTNEEFKTAVKTQFGENNQKVNDELNNEMKSLNNSSKIDNITLETFKEKMEFFEKLSKDAPASTTATSTDTTTATSTDTTTATSTDTTAAPVTTTAATEAYAIIQIDVTGIKVLDAVPEGTLNTGTPYDLLAQKTKSIFAVKIVKKEKGACNTTNFKIKCINYGDSVYEMDLTKSVTLDNSKLLSEDFLKSVDANGADASSVDANSADAKDANSADAKDAKGADANSADASSVDANSAGSEGSNGNGSEVAVSKGISTGGGSRKTLGPKSKKTKRNYYLYKR